MKRTAAIAALALALPLLGACSAQEEPGAISTTEAGPNQTQNREYKLADGTTIEYNRLAPLPAEMTTDLQARLDSVLFEPDVEAYLAAAATEAGAGPDTDNFLAFKAEANKIGQDTGKYVGAIIRAVQTCGDESAVTWAFAAQDRNAPQFPECGSTDAKAEAAELAEHYIPTAIGGTEAWIVLGQQSNQ